MFSGNFGASSAFSSILSITEVFDGRSPLEMIVRPKLHIINSVATTAGTTMLDKNYSIIKNVPYYKSISKIHGYGIFASENIKKNTIISKCFDEIKTRDNKPTADFTNICKFINHSYNTNSKLKKIPFIRGLFILVEMMIIGFRSLSKSSEVLEENQDEMSLLEKLFSYVFSTVFLLTVLSVFFLLPLFLSDRVVFFENNFVVNNIVEGIVRLIFCILYV